MDEQEYIELNTLLTKLRVVCLKTLGKIDVNLNEDNMRILRRMREENVSMIRSIDNIKRFMPLSIGIDKDRGENKSEVLR